MSPTVMTLRQSFYCFRRFNAGVADEVPDWVPDPMCEAPEPVVTTRPNRRPVPRVPSLWTPLPFGKHIGRTLPQVLFTDPDWFFWGVEEEAFAYQDLDVRREVDRIHRRATAIRPPHLEGKSESVEYMTQNGVFAGIQLAPADAPSDDLTLDMSSPHSLKPYDKRGNNLLIGDMKEIWFGDRSYRMNRARCEAFFNDLRWFPNP